MNDSLCPYIFPPIFYSCWSFDDSCPPGLGKWLLLCGPCSIWHCANFRWDIQSSLQHRQTFNMRFDVLFYLQFTEAEKPKGMGWNITMYFGDICALSWRQWVESPFCVSSVVHELRPADIKVVAAVGDSTTVSVVIHRYPVYYFQKNEMKKKSNIKQQQTRTYC